MSKYTNEQLKKMATEFIEAEKNGDMRCGFLMMKMQMLTRMHNADIHSRIVAFSNLET